MAKKIEIPKTSTRAPKWTNNDRVLLLVKDLLDEYARTITIEIDFLKESVNHIPVIRKNGIETKVSMTLQEGMQNLFNEIASIRNDTLPKMQKEIDDLYDPFKTAERFNQRGKTVMEFVKYVVIFLLALGVALLYGKLIGI